MKKVKFLVATCLASVFIGCGNSGLIPLKNKNPKINEQRFAKLLEFLNT